MQTITITLEHSSSSVDRYHLDSREFDYLPMNLTQEPSVSFIVDRLLAHGIKVSDVHVTSYSEFTYDRWENVDTRTKTITLTIKEEKEEEMDLSLPAEIRLLQKAIEETKAEGDSDINRVTLKALEYALNEAIELSRDLEYAYYESLDVLPTYTDEVATVHGDVGQVYFNREEYTPNNKNTGQYIDNYVLMARTMLEIAPLEEFIYLILSAIEFKTPMKCYASHGNNLDIIILDSKETKSMLLTTMMLQ